MSSESASRSGMSRADDSETGTVEHGQIVGEPSVRDERTGKQWDTDTTSTDGD